MKWTRYHNKVQPKLERPRFGDKKIKKRFCIFPTSYYDSKTDRKIYYWLQTVYVVYEWTKCFSYFVCDNYFTQTDYWEKIGIASSYSNAVREIWG